MDPITLSLIGSGINLGAGLLGQLLGSADDAQAYAYRKQALAKYMGISVPELEKLVAKEQGPSNLANVHTDPALDAYQDEAQVRLAEIGRDGGLDARARARLEQVRMESARDQRNAREGVLADARARGTLGTGTEISALLQAGQADADQARMADLQVLSDAEGRALDAIMAGGSMAAERQGRQWGQRAQVATAQDEIDRFNTQTANNFTLANADARQQHFQNQMQLAGAQAGALNNMAGHEEDRAERTRQAVGGVGQAVGYGFGAYAQGMSRPQSATQPRQATAYEVKNPGAIGTNAALTPALQRRKAR